MLRVSFFGACALALAAAALSAPASAAVPQPYGTDDAGGFRNVLPPGQAGTNNASDLVSFQLTGARPRHFDDQLPLYEGLLYASPTLTREDIPRFFKDATFGVKPEDVERTYSPRPGVTIVRDKGFGVPRVYGEERADVNFGAGYVGAEDRLFLMDVLRHTGRAQLSSFAGGTPGNREMDRVQWTVAPYTEADLQRQIDQADDLYGAAGARVVEDLNAYVDGINAYIAEARRDPSKMPSEYAAFGRTVEDWKPTDVIATASLVGGIFGKGGGEELESALALQAFEDRFGRRRGRRAWRDFRAKNDPEAYVTVKRKRFPYQTRSAFAKRGLALPDRGSVQEAPVAPPVPRATVRADDRSFGARLLLQRTGPAHASNWEVVNAKRSATGKAIGVLGPQVGYYVPQILTEIELHGPGYDARGTAFPGVNLVVQLGRGRDYAWSATTAYSDNVDTFAEVLCRDDFHYRYMGECLPMEKLERTNTFAPSPGAPSSPRGSETLTAYRTVHGIVFARGRVKGRKVAFVRARTTYFHEADSAIGFQCLNDPACVRDPRSFRKAVDGINFGFNWAYVDADHTAYQHSGWYPKRAKGVSPDFPVLGTGEYDWRGFDPQRRTQRILSMDERPHVVDQPYTVSWNGKQARGWAAADDQYAWSSIQRGKMIEDRIRRALRGGRKIGIEQLVQAMEEPATQDIRGLYVLPWLVRAMRRIEDPALREAVDTLQEWRRAGAHRRDLDKDGTYEHDEAVTLMDAWWPEASRAIFRPALGENVVEALTEVIPYDAELGPGKSPNAPAFASGWYGYVHKDLRALVAPRRVDGRWSRVYCGGGRRAAGRRGRCARRLRESLERALGTTREQLYGRGPCADDATARCFDMNRNTVASAVTTPDMTFQNRPTFQQVAEPQRRLPR